MLTILIVVLLVLLIFGALPAYPYSRNWGYGPIGLLVTVLAVIVVLAFFGVL